MHRDGGCQRRVLCFLTAGVQLDVPPPASDRLRGCLRVGGGVSGLLSHLRFLPCPRLVKIRPAGCVRSTGEKDLFRAVKDGCCSKAERNFARADTHGVQSGEGDAKFCRPALSIRSPGGGDALRYGRYIRIYHARRREGSCPPRTVRCQVELKVVPRVRRGDEELRCVVPPQVGLKMIFPCLRVQQGRGGVAGRKDEGILREEEAELERREHGLAIPFMPQLLPEALLRMLQNDLHARQSILYQAAGQGKIAFCLITVAGGASFSYAPGERTQSSGQSFTRGFTTLSRTPNKLALRVRRVYRGGVLW